ncbi:stage II sporulation protein R [Salinibacillus kushneri]|uniref:Stage II sporulation protein R n=1 Tax=Salinibacillus kushneri TaxID=237682 RepID=A0A1I0CVA3_9BACI|nr:stage II sporulation protein R [Salinibacillus kushneri]SET23743.1 stage II sporulation protein R [Salinibacillus kushneri]
MKRIVFIFVSAFILFYNPMIGYGNQNANQEEEYQVIPDDSIRLRILAHSNSEKDQQVKHEIRDQVNQEITKWVNELTNIETARDLIQSKLPEIETIVANVLKENDIHQTFDLEFGDVQFPSKLYGGQVYPAGTYEALLITIGDGKGDNWWCVLFPPLCFLDFSNGTTVASAEEDTTEMSNPDTQKVEVEFFVVDWFHSIVDWLKNLF